MKAFLAISGGCVLVLAMAAVAVVVWQTHQNTRLTAANASLAAQLEESKEAADALTSANTEISAQLDALQASAKALQSRVETLEAEAQTAAQRRPEPCRVRAFLGKENVGGAWIIPHNLTTDPESGRYVYEPILLIDESAKRHFTVPQTNVLEREVYTTQIYQENPAYPYYYYVTPGRPGRPDKPERPPGQPRQPPPVATPGIASQPDANARVFAPPMSVVNSRPQVIGRPGTSPSNIRVFAP